MVAAHCFAYSNPLPRQPGRWQDGVSGHREPVPSSLMLLVSSGDPPHLHSRSPVSSIHSSVNHYFPKEGWLSRPHRRLIPVAEAKGQKGALESMMQEGIDRTNSMQSQGASLLRPSPYRSTEV